MIKSTDKNSPQQIEKPASSSKKSVPSKAPIMHSPTINIGDKTAKSDFISDANPVRNDPDHQLKMKKINQDMTIPPLRTDKTKTHDNQKEKLS